MVVHVVPSLLHKNYIIVATLEHLCNGWHPLVLSISQPQAPHVQVEDLQVKGANSRPMLRSKLAHLFADGIGEKPGGRQGGESVLAWMKIALSPSQFVVTRNY